MFLICRHLKTRTEKMSSKYVNLSKNQTHHIFFKKKHVVSTPFRKHRNFSARLRKFRRRSMEFERESSDEVSEWPLGGEGWEVTERIQVGFEKTSLDQIQRLRWWFQIFLYFHPYLGKIPILTNIFQRG